MTPSAALVANLETRCSVDSRGRRSARSEPCFAAIAGVAGVLAAGLIRDDLQAHLALAEVVPGLVEL
jgi:hypothetical protein